MKESVQGTGTMQKRAGTIQKKGAGAITAWAPRMLT